MCTHTRSDTCNTTQHTFNLQGWGCGYRSLQSLCSWAENKLRLNMPASAEHPLPNVKGYGHSMTASVPSLRRIQEILFEVDDKPPSFVGSREWIGSYEACIILDHLYCVSETVLFVKRVRCQFMYIGVTEISCSHVVQCNLQVKDTLGTIMFCMEFQSRQN